MSQRNIDLFLKNLIQNFNEFKLFSSTHGKILRPDTIKEISACIGVEEWTPNSHPSSALATVYSWLCFFSFLPFRTLQPAINQKIRHLCAKHPRTCCTNKIKCKLLHLLSTALYLQLKESDWRHRSWNGLKIALVWLLLLLPGWALGCLRGTDKESRSFKGLVCPSPPAYFFDFVQSFNFTLSGETDEIRKGFLRMNNSTGIT